MKVQIAFLFIFESLIKLTIAQTKYVEGYYWWDYQGIIPADAVSAGFDSRGHMIYIGQVLKNNSLIPGKIFENDTNIYYEWREQELSTDENIHILCTRYPEMFYWQATKVQNVANLSRELLIIGGYQPGFITHVGRINENGGYNVGKVICHEVTYNCLALYAGANGRGTEYKAFEILSYNPNDVNFKILHQRSKFYSIV